MGYITKRGTKEFKVNPELLRQGTTMRRLDTAPDPVNSEGGRPAAEPAQEHEAKDLAQ